jgi:hypothetical protein
MSTGPTCHWTRSRFARAMILSTLLLVTGSPPNLAAGEPDVSNHGSAATIKGVVVDEKANPQAGILVHCSDVENKKMMLGEIFSGKDGSFELPISPLVADKPQCWIDGGNVYETDEKTIPSRRDSKVVFT